MAFMRSMVTSDGGVATWWDFTVPTWTHPTGYAVEDSGFLAAPFQGAHVRERKAWPAGMYVSGVTIVTDTDGLTATFALTEIT